MNLFSAQLILAEFGQETENWTNILYIVVLAVFWIVGGIIKATRNKPKPENTRKEQASGQPQRRPVQMKSNRPSVARPTKTVGPGQPQTGQQPARKAPAKPRSRLERLAAEFEKALEPYISDTTSKPKPRPQPKARKPVVISPKIPSGQKPMDLPRNVLVDRKGVGPEPLIEPFKETPEPELPELVFDYTDPDELTKAILYYEILGPPLSLRNPSHQNIGF
jgi:hypothetical protein